MSHVTISGGTSAVLSFDTRENRHLARQLAAALRRHAIVPPHETYPGIVHITLADAIRAGIVQFVHFDWDTFELDQQD